MRGKHIFAVLLGFAVVAILAADASAMYHPTVGRFMQRDPGPAGPVAPRIGQYGPSGPYADGMNAYEYARGSPATRLDANGTSSCTLSISTEQTSGSRVGLTYRGLQRAYGTTKCVQWDVEPSAVLEQCPPPDCRRIRLDECTASIKVWASFDDPRALSHERDHVSIYERNWEQVAWKALEYEQKPCMLKKKAECYVKALKMYSKGMRTAAELEQLQYEMEKMPKYGVKPDFWARATEAVWKAVAAKQVVGALEKEKECDRM